jgi:hypothetical protein
MGALDRFSLATPCVRHRSFVCARHIASDGLTAALQSFVQTVCCVTVGARARVLSTLLDPNSATPHGCW